MIAAKDVPFCSERRDPIAAKDVNAAKDVPLCSERRDPYAAKDVCTYGERRVDGERRDDTFEGRRKTQKTCHFAAKDVLKFGVS